MMEIVAGLSCAAVMRQKTVWNQLPQAAKDSWQRLDSVMSPQGGYKNYYQEVANRANSSILPYFGEQLFFCSFFDLRSKSAL